MTAEERTDPEYDQYRRPSDAKDVVGTAATVFWNRAGTDQIQSGFS
jgi:hypothetical protein